ncbi:MAG: hypothetical protein KDA84_10620 [Planctomycetaceae bacterium]|nr:hypothetical protein [Planctomycetaceae bacterium]
MAKKKKRTSGNKTQDWIIRIVIFGVLGIALIIGAIEFRAKRQAVNTSQAWLKMVDESETSEDKAFVMVKDLKDSIEGSPEVAKKTAENGKTHLVYTWKGVFGEYVATVESETGGENSIVEKVVGLGTSKAE